VIQQWGSFKGIRSDALRDFMRDYLLTSFVGDPPGGSFKAREKHASGVFYFCFTFATFRKQASYGASVKQKNRAEHGFSGFGGERGSNAIVLTD